MYIPNYKDLIEFKDNDVRPNKAVYISCHVCELTPPEASCPLCKGWLNIPLQKVYPTIKDLVYYLEKEESAHYVPITHGFNAVQGSIKNGSMKDTIGEVVHYNCMTQEITIQIDSLTKIITHRANVALNINWNKIIEEVYSEIL